MKKIGIFACIIAILICFSGCGKTLPSGQVTYDAFLSGDDLTFSYNKEARFLTLGGVVSYQQADIVKGFDEAGYYVGLTFVAPSGVTDLETGSLEYLNKKISGGEFYTRVNGSKVARFTIYPRLEDNVKEFEIKVTWQEGTQEQIYKVRIENVEFKKDA